jgi:hypothetical protein
VTKTQTRESSNARSSTARAPRTALTARTLVGMSQPQLDEVFRRSQAGPIPTGTGDGTAVFATGGPLPELIAAVAPLAWRGKVFDRDGKALRNRIGPLGLLAIRARVRYENSLFDGKRAIVLDYSRDPLAFFIRDEMREVAPRLYLGIVYLNRRKTVNFALDFKAAA